MLNFFQILTTICQILIVLAWFRCDLGEVLKAILAELGKLPSKARFVSLYASDG